MTGAVIRVYRAGFSRIESPDVGIGRRTPISAADSIPRRIPASYRAGRA